MSFLDGLASIAKLNRSYVEGQRQAEQDNWKNLENFNNVLRGQRENAFGLATWDNALANANMQTINNEFTTTANGIENAARLLGAQGYLQDAYDRSNAIMAGMNNDARMLHWGQIRAQGGFGNDNSRNMIQPIDWSHIVNMAQQQQTWPMYGYGGPPYGGYIAQPQSPASNAVPSLNGENPNRLPPQ